MPPVSNAVMDLADDQRFALMKFRRSVSDCLKPGQGDPYLLRWLKARNFDPEAAEKMLRESLQWRTRWDVDRLLTHWEPPLVLKQFFPSGICGTDKEGVPVIMLPFSGLDIWGLLHSVSKADFIRMTAMSLEKYLGESTANLEKAGKPSCAPTLIAIMDMEHFSIKPYTWRPAGEVVLSLIHMYEANYPEILKACYIINAPSIFSMAFSIVRPFLHENTVQKIHIFSSNTRKWKAALLEHINTDQLPAHYGGTQVGPDGDTKCTHKVHQGGKVPKSMYQKAEDLKDDIGGEWLSATVKKGDRLQLHYDVAEKGSFLRWEFRTEQHDIQFAVYKCGDDGSRQAVVEPRKVSCQDKGAPEVGVHNCTEAPAKYMIEFDNSHSMLRTKKLHYQILVAPPLLANADSLTDSLAAIVVS
ncbi:SEC14-like protein 2 isoform X2 [Neocloeon triangulifer]|uniref:SEC14-like protein 2 isoform X2 n=1 Tax=Neocloeon triangulifer TaxID=2078957 RepID=UPI00286F4CD6|nr:SEC14-like protein 2 isoform X2 [Neocloeon triangulifer]